MDLCMWNITSISGIRVNREIKNALLKPRIGANMMKTTEKCMAGSGKAV